MDMKKRIVIMLLLAAVMLNGCKPDSTAEHPAADTMTTLDRVSQTEEPNPEGELPLLESGRADAEYRFG